MSTESRARDHANLRDLAKLGYESADSSGDAPAEENSGVVDLASLMAPAIAAPVVEEQHAKSESPPPRPKTRRWLTVAGLLAAAAAGGLATQVFGAAHRAPGPMSPVAILLATTAALPAPSEEPSAASSVRSPVAAGSRDLDPASLPAATPASTAHAARPAPSVPATRTSKAVEEPPSEEPQPAATASGGDVTLQAAMQQAVGPTSTLAPTSTASAAPDDTSDVAAHGVPLRPALGAVDAALGETMPDARSCLDRDDPISRATVTFRPDGHPASVSVSGGAKGKPAESCIRAALMKTRVGPFALDTFSVPVTIRPN